MTVETISKFAGKNPMNFLCIQIFKTLSNKSPAFMNEIFEGGQIG